jgi:hypothetical protein
MKRHFSLFFKDDFLIQKLGMTALEQFGWTLVEAENAWLES